MYIDKKRRRIKGENRRPKRRLKKTVALFFYVNIYAITVPKVLKLIKPLLNALKWLKLKI